MSDVPDSIRESLARYVHQGVRPGGFLYAVLCNDLQEAVGAADPTNLAALKAIVQHIHWEVPSPCHGSTERVERWIAERLAELGGVP